MREIRKMAWVAAVWAATIGVYAVRSRGPWRKVYGHLLGGVLYATAIIIINQAVARGGYHAGKLLNLSLVASFLWLGTAGGRLQGLAGLGTGLGSDQGTRRGSSIAAKRRPSFAAGDRRSDVHAVVRHLDITVQRS